MRPRKWKAHEQATGQASRGSTSWRSKGAKARTTRVRSRYGFVTRYDSKEEDDYWYQELGHDGRVTIQYERPARVRDRDALSYD